MMHCSLHGMHMPGFAAAELQHLAILSWLIPDLRLIETLHIWLQRCMVPCHNVVQVPPSCPDSRADFNTPYMLRRCVWGIVSVCVGSVGEWMSWKFSLALDFA